MTRVQNSLLNIVREWTGVQDLSLLPQGHPGRIFIERSLEDLENHEMNDLVKMLESISNAYWVEIEKIIPQ